jgi:superfamily II DNA or RNA helicase
MLTGYIYLRNHESYIKYNVYKLGITYNIPDRDNQYVTGEVKRGKFILVIETDENIEQIEKSLHTKFSDYKFIIDGGTEFFNSDILVMIIPFLKTLNIKFRVLSEIEIENLIRTKRKNILKIIPNEQQIEVINKAQEFYKKHDIGKLIWACGLGKSLAVILIIQKLLFKTIVIGTPSKYLQNQFKQEILKIFPNEENILCIGSDKITDATTNPEEIKKFFNKNSSEPIFIITTYYSCYLLVNYIFDFKVGDEAHHLVGDNIEGYKKFHEIKSKKTIFMTATEKVVDVKDNKKIYTMNNNEIFGEYIDCKSVNWAIEHKKITDYAMMCIRNTEDELNEIIKLIGEEIENKELFLACYVTLKSIETYPKMINHVLMFTNCIENAELTKKYIDIIIRKKILDLNEIYNESLHSKKSGFNKEVKKFEEADIGIIHCVYIFGEGFDLPKLNAVVFAETMISLIRIVQTCLRPARLEKGNLSKIAHIILPYIENVYCDHKSFDRVKNTVEQIRTVDENVEQKIKVIHFTHSDKKSDDSEKEDNKTEITNINVLEKIKIHLRHCGVLNSNNSEEQDEYNYFKSINKQFNYVSKEDYVKRKLENNTYIEDPKSYFSKKSVWDNWCDFLGLDTSKYIKSLTKWKDECEKLNIKSVEDYEIKCKTNPQLPSNPVDFYKDFKNINFELGLNRSFR